MKITVLNGSPKGDTSVTMQYVKYMSLKFPMHEFRICNVAHSIRKLEADSKELEALMDDIESSDGVLWAFPVYVYLVHGSYKRFIELIWEKNLQKVFEGKYTAALSTSIHFFDNTAHNYIRGICDDLKMKYIGFFSPEMNDILKERGQKELTAFTADMLRNIESRSATSFAYKPLNCSIPFYKPSYVKNKTDMMDKKVVIITDSYDLDTNLGKMIKRFMDSIVQPVELINISEINIKGGCLGCISCGFDNQCVYDYKDDIRYIYDEKIKKADILVYAGAIKDRYLSALWKTFIDRRFFNTHQPILTGKQLAYIISGPLGQVHNLREILHANAELDQANLVDIITDEYENSEHVDMLLENLAQRLKYFSGEAYVRPATYLGVGGMRIFRDEVWGRLRMVFQGDHRYYKKNGIYDFPQKSISIRLMNMVMILLTKMPGIKKNMQKNFTQYMIQSYSKAMKDI
ncbi:MAG: NAD(P)H-dependent oxidoreductase [Bacillota bacterium]